MRAWPVLRHGLPAAQLRDSPGETPPRPACTGKERRIDAVEQHAGAKWVQRLAQGRVSSAHLDRPAHPPCVVLQPDLSAPTTRTTARWQRPHRVAWSRCGNCARWARRELAGHGISAYEGGQHHDNPRPPIAMVPMAVPLTSGPTGPCQDPTRPRGTTNEVSLEQFQFRLAMMQRTSTRCPRQNLARRLVECVR